MSKLPDPKKAIDEQVQFARSRGADSLRMMRRALAQTLHAVEDCADRFNASDDLSEQAECVNRAMLRICTDLLPTLRIDTASDAQAALLLAAAQKVPA